MRSQRSVRGWKERGREMRGKEKKRKEERKKRRNGGNSPNPNSSIHSDATDRSSILLTDDAISVDQL